MRVHEFAKQHNLSSKEVLDLLRAEGFEVKSHMAVMSDEVLEFLKKRQTAPKGVEQSSTVELPPVAKKVDERQDHLVPVQSQPKHTNPQFAQTAPEPLLSVEKVVQLKDPIVLEPMSVSDFASKADFAVNEVILTLLKQGKPCAKNYLLSEPMVRALCVHYGIETKAPIAQKKEVLIGAAFSLSKENEQKRLPVVVVMGHVDHGKTTLLDFIRRTRVAAKEKGGITQHLGAYSVKTSHGDIVFLDTPGHEAFSKIRKRGASVADIAILVVAADDGIMPQTIESIKAIKALAIPVIVAINKMDRVEPQRVETIKRQLVQHEMLPEEWGGNVICVPISAKEGTGVDQLLELIALQAEMMELKASITTPAQGYVLESRMVKGLGPVATVILRQGVLKIGDNFIAGSVVGKIISLTDSFGDKLKEVFPSVPVLVAGFADMPGVGEQFQIVSEAEYKKARSAGDKAVTSQTYTHNPEVEKFHVILKADTHSSLEAILDAIKELGSKKELKVISVLRFGVGDITESDALLAESTGATIIGFNVKTEHNAIIEARKSDVKISIFGIIYKLLEDLALLAAKAQEIKMVLTKIGQATVLKVFNIKKLGVIAGCSVNEGRFSEKGIVVVMRSRREIARGKIKSLQRDKKSVKEVHSGFECGFIVEGFEEWEEGDIAECHLNIPSPVKPS